MGTTAEHVHDFGAPVAGFGVDCGSLRGSLWRLLGLLGWPSAVTFKSDRECKHHVVRHNRVLRRLNHALKRHNHVERWGADVLKGYKTN